MLLKRIRLKNIRSYEELELEFGEGSTLLAGDIGSGKSTILLGVEFALFGLVRGFITGETLLRHGKKSGEVELGFELEGKEIVVLRSLKRNNNGVAQDNGFFSINGVKTDATPVEIKSKIISLLGYPEDLVTKSKSLIYRYTVYTPQEEMKRILFMPADERLETIRKLFDIDKYKRVRENAALHAKTLRAEVKGLRVIAGGISSVKEKVKGVEERISEKKKLLEDKRKGLKEQKEREKKASEKLEVMEGDAKKLFELKKSLEFCESKIRSFASNISGVKEDVISAEKELGEPLGDEPVKGKDREAIKKEADEYNKKLDETNEKLVGAREKLAVVRDNVVSSKRIIDGVDELDVCPTCRQKVDEEHKKVLVGEEKDKIKGFEDKEKKFLEYIGRAEKNIRVIREKINALNEEFRKASVAEEKRRAFEEKKKRREALKKRIGELRERLALLEKEKGEANKEKASLKEKIDGLLVDENVLKEVKKNLDGEKEKTRELEVSIARLEEEIKGFEKERESLGKELKEKEKAEREANYKASMSDWMVKNFIGVMGVIEKHVLGSIHSEFSSKFEDWFNILLEDENISASLDDSFSPVVVQNGFDVGIEGLSGGEKTSVALAYRLALNKVVNDYMSCVKTRDLLILDEPTDGFSSEQLDKVRDVLQELNVRQTIIVSHDVKVESFVENIVRVVKEEHSSKIV